MILPVQLTFRSMDPSPEAEDWIREEAAKLDTFCPEIVSCRVAVDVPHREREWGNPYQIRIDLSVPGKELAVTHEPNLHSSAQRLRRTSKAKSLEVRAPYKELHLAIREAFKAVRRQLQDYVRLRRREIKTHAETPRARVSRLFPEEGYGFIATPGGREVYFHRNSVLDGEFGRLEIGSEVNFAEEEGEKGPQASTVKLTRPHRSPYRENKTRRPVRTREG